ncbi:MAG TPA: ATP-binding protein [Polyangiaceae bacterium]|nr:ATP-binding protein [Polyangiaceae bacterium]
MTVAAKEERSLDELTLGSALLLEELVDRSALSEMAQSFHELFGMPLRIFSEAGLLLADASAQPAIYEYLAEKHRRAKAALQEVVTAVKRVDPGARGEASYTCFTGGVYHVVAIRYDGRQLGRMVLGPFLPPATKDIPQSLLAVEPDVDVVAAKELLLKMPRAREETVRQIARHLRVTLDLILFSGHKALLTSSMHLASVRESFRDLQEKNGKLQEAYDRLKELDRLKSNFLATVSHELRTPLTSIIGYSEMLAEGIAGDMTVEQKDFVRTIHEKGEQLLELISGLLDLSKLESGTLAVKKIDVVVGDLVADVVNTVSPTARKRGVTVTSDVAAGLPKLWGDPTRLRQVLLNLTDNALKFTPQGGTVALSARLISVDLSPEDDDGGLVLLRSKQPAIEIRVADDGIGIPDAEKTKVFDAFYQVDSSSTRQVGGTGLGLSIVKRLVEGHDGRVTIEDNEPKGAIFVVTLPLKRATLS